MPLIRKILKLLLGVVVIAVLVGILANLLGTPKGPLQITLFVCLFVATLIAYIVLEFADQTREKNEGLVQRNRRRMLEKVRNFWIDGVLNQSLYHVSRLDLGLVEQPDAIEHPWKLVVQQPERAPRLLPDGMPMHAVFEQFDKTLLLLGAPGSGKTTLLLELARDLIKQAEKDSDHPIPVVFNLSSWAQRRPSIMEWLVDELNERYDVPRKIGQHWVDNQQVLPLLDGLDEVSGGHREDCVKAINDFRVKYGLLPLVVCSRVADYEALTVRLRLPGAVTIQPLTQKQIELFMEKGGKSLEQVRTLLNQDSTLWELLDTPLVLSMMRLAFHGESEAVVLLDAGTSRERRGQLFDAYIGAMFKRRETDTPYTPQQIRHWLIWLANSMVHHNQTIFYLEQMQSIWLSKTHARIQKIGFQLIVFLVVFLVGGLIILLGGWLGLGMGDWLVFGPAGGLGVVLTVLLNGLSGRLDSGLVGGLVSWLVGGLVSWLVGGVWGLVAFMYVYILVFAPEDAPWLKPTEEIHWSWKEARRGMREVPVFGLIILVFGLIILLDGQPVGRLGFLAVLLFILLLGGLLLGGLVEKEITTRTIPNEVIRHSLRNALSFGLFSGLFFGLLILLLILLDSWLGLGGLSGSMLLLLQFKWLLTVLIFGMFKGGYFCIRHGILRALLWRNGYAPFNYVRFLDDAVERIFLRRIGGGYIFVHRLVMEHFARLEIEGSKS